MATPEEAAALTFVFWDIKSFPLPPGFDARRLHLCIKRLLEKYGYFGPLTITSGSTLSHDWIREISPPANILGICHPSALPPPQSGYNLFRPFSYSSRLNDAILWESLILAGVCLSSLTVLLK